MPRDAWIALVVAAASAVSLWELARTPASGAFVKATTFPFAVCVAMLALSLLLFAGALRRRARQTGGTPASLRAAGLCGLTVLYVAALPWTGYFATSALYFGALSVAFGNRRPVSVVIAMVLVPLALLLFFEKYMIVLLPAARLFE